MIGLYIHVPFCKKACIYCDFHFSTKLNQTEQFTNALCQEIHLQERVHKETLSSIYFGGGTPTLLDSTQFQAIFTTLQNYFHIPPNIEITIEANPDDLTPQKLNLLKQLPFNRLSIGVQSFNQRELAWMNRSHTAKQAEYSIKKAQDIGFFNLNIDLIYGLPSVESIQQSLEKTLALNISHLSIYQLTVEPKTKLAFEIENARVTIDEKKALDDHQIIMQTLTQNNYEHYEVSNFCRDKKYAVHNSNYWKGFDYIGFGPSAHSKIGALRMCNISNNQRYYKGVSAQTLAFQTQEKLDEQARYNEFIITRLRAKWGLDVLDLKHTFAPHFYQYFNQALLSLNPLWYSREDQLITLTEQGMLFSNRVYLALIMA